MKKKLFIKFVLISLLVLNLIPLLFFVFSPKESYLYEKTKAISRRIYYEIIYKKYFQTLVNIIELDKSKLPKTLPEYHIRLKKEYFDKLNDELPLYVKTNFYRASLEAEGRLEPVSVRYRGDNPTHWYSAKKSWRIKLPRGKQLDGERRINLITPQRKHYFNDYLAYKIAGEIGLFSPKTKFVAGYLNKKFMGVYYKTQQTDRLFEIHNQKMEGSIYGLEVIAQIGKQPSWTGERPWDVIYKSGRESKEDEKLFTDFILKQSNLDTPLEEITKVLSTESMLKWKAILLLFSSFHMDAVHNHKIYHDPIEGKLHYVPWDVGEMEPRGMIDRYFMATPLEGRLFIYPEIIFELQQYLYDIITNSHPYHEVKQDLENQFNKVFPYIKRQLYKEYRLSAYSTDEFKEKFFDLLTRWKERYQEYLDAFTKVELKKINDKEVVFFAEVPLIITDINKQKRIVYPNYKMKKIKRNWIFHFGFQDKEVKFLPTKFKSKSEILEITNAITKKVVNPTIFKHDLSRASLAKSKRIDIPSKQIVWSGRKLIEKDLIIDKNTDLLIKAGTTILIAPDTSILIYGHVKSVGKKKQPIIFKRLKPEKAWGTVALQKSGTKENASLFEYTIFDGGKDGRIGNVFYSGALSAYYSHTKVKNCIFYNSLGDDAINIKKGHSVVSNNFFYKNHFDAIDFDYTSGFIQENFFLANGNDGVDLGTATPTVVKNYIFKSGDKGISLGEYSHAKISNNFIFENNIGVAIKDASSPFLKSNLFKSNKHAVFAYRKKSLFSGSNAVGESNCFVANEISTQQDPYSSINFEKSCEKVPKLENGAISKLLEILNNNNFVQKKNQIISQFSLWNKNEL